MGLITSVAEAQAMLQASKNTSGSRDTSASGFSDILKQSFSNITEDMDAIFEEAAAKFQIPSKLLKSVAKAESNFNPKAVSGAGAMGVMQLMPGTAKSLGVTDPFDARQNIMGGAKYLKENLDRFGDVKLALAAYNAGPGSVKKYNGIPPYEETQNYVKKVTSYMGGDTLYANRSVETGGTSGISSYAAGRSGGTGWGSFTSLSGYEALGALMSLGSSASVGSLPDTDNSSIFGSSSGFGSASAFGSLAALSSLMGLGSSSGLGSYGALSSLMGLDSSLLSGKYAALGENTDQESLADISDYINSITNLKIQEDGDNIIMSKESFASLIQMMRVQMLMNSDGGAGFLTV